MKDSSGDSRKNSLATGRFPGYKHQSQQRQPGTDVVEIENFKLVSQSAKLSGERFKRKDYIINKLVPGILAE